MRAALTTHPWIARATAIALMLAAVGCGNKFRQETPVRERGSATVGFADPEIAALGRPQGPYVFIKALSPSTVELADMNAQSAPFRLIGLSEQGYPDPATDAEGNPLPKPDEATLLKKHTDMKKFKTAALEQMCKKGQCWIIRMNDARPPMVYLLISDRMLSPNETPTGDATLINAQTLRKGVGNMELEELGGAPHPLYDQMLDAQALAVIDARKSRTDGKDVWTTFKMEPPRDSLASQRVEEMDKGAR